MPIYRCISTIITINNTICTIILSSLTRFHWEYCQIKNENKLEEMVCILEHLQRYVPTARQETKHQITSTEEETTCLERFHRVLLGGDQLTVARVRSCQRGRANSDSAVNRFNGLLPIAEDWHTGVILLTVSIKSMLSTVVGPYPNSLLSFHPCQHNLVILPPPPPPPPPPPHPGTPKCMQACV